MKREASNKKEKKMIGLVLSIIVVLGLGGGPEDFGGGCNAL